VAVLWQSRHPDGRLARQARHSEVQGILWVVRLIYGFGVPYAALLMGLMSPRLFGLAEINWVQSLGLGGALAGIALAILVLGWWGYRREVPPPADLLPWPLALLGIAALQGHWALYRTGATLWLNDTYGGVWVGLALVALEAALVPSTWRALATPDQAEKLLRPAAFAFSSAVLFYYTHNLWLCCAFHCIGEMALTRWIPSYANRGREKPAS
ncbi:MAG: hypothetical protein IT330_07165, partial [Anaerolineae bacterium]|nr:hypothetical protein [Anaerolineae bacterium]